MTVPFREAARVAPWVARVTLAMSFLDRDARSCVACGAPVTIGVEMVRPEVIASVACTEPRCALTFAGDDREPRGVRARNPATADNYARVVAPAAVDRARAVDDAARLGGFVDTGNGAWLDLVASSVFGVDRRPGESDDVLRRRAAAAVDPTRPAVESDATRRFMSAMIPVDAAREAAGLPKVGGAAGAREVPARDVATVGPDGTVRFDALRLQRLTDVALVDAANAAAAGATGSRFAGIIDQDDASIVVASGESRFAGIIDDGPGRDATYVMTDPAADVRFVADRSTYANDLMGPVGVAVSEQRPDGTIDVSISPAPEVAATRKYLLDRDRAVVEVPRTAVAEDPVSLVTPSRMVIAAFLGVPPSTVSDPRSHPLWSSGQVVFVVDGTWEFDDLRRLDDAMRRVWPTSLAVRVACTGEGPVRTRVLADDIPSAMSRYFPAPANPRGQYVITASVGMTEAQLAEVRDALGRAAAGGPVTLPASAVVRVADPPSPMTRDDVVDRTRLAVARAFDCRVEEVGACVRPWPNPTDPSEVVDTLDVVLCFDATADVVAEITRCARAVAEQASLRAVVRATRGPVTRYAMRPVRESFVPFFGEAAVPRVGDPSFFDAAPVPVPSAARAAAVVGLDVGGTPVPGGDAYASYARISVAGVPAPSTDASTWDVPSQYRVTAGTRDVTREQLVVCARAAIAWAFDAPGRDDVRVRVEEWPRARTAGSDLVLVAVLAFTTSARAHAAVELHMGYAIGAQPLVARVRAGTGAHRDPTRPVADAFRRYFGGMVPP